MLHLRDLPGVHDQLCLLAELERECCPFLGFEVVRAEGALAVRISAAPGSAPEVSAELDRLIPMASANGFRR